MNEKEHRELKLRDKLEKIIKRIDDEMEKLEWLRSNALIQGWNIGRKLRR